MVDNDLPQKPAASKKIGVKLRGNYYLCTVTVQEQKYDKHVSAISVVTSEKIHFKIPSDDRPINEQLTEGLDRMLHSKKYKKTIEILPKTVFRLLRPRTAPPGGRKDQHMFQDNYYYDINRTNMKSRNSYKNDKSNYSYYDKNMRNRGNTLNDFEKQGLISSSDEEGYNDNADEFLYTSSNDALFHKMAASSSFSSKKNHKIRNKRKNKNVVHGEMMIIHDDELTTNDVNLDNNHIQQINLCGNDDKEYSMINKNVDKQKSTHSRQKVSYKYDYDITTDSSRSKSPLTNIHCLGDNDNISVQLSDDECSMISINSSSGRRKSSNIKKKSARARLLRLDSAPSLLENVNFSRKQPFMPGVQINAEDVKARAKMGILHDPKFLSLQEKTVLSEYSNLEEILTTPRKNQSINNFDSNLKNDAKNVKTLSKIDQQLLNMPIKIMNNKKVLKS